MRIPTQFVERSGLNYHEAQYSFALDTRALPLDMHIDEEYRSSCEMSPFKLKFRLIIKEASHSTAMCIMLMKRIDNLSTLITVCSTLRFEFPASPVFHSPETEMACNQEIMDILGPILNFTDLHSPESELLHITLSLAVFNCHRNKRERGISLSSDEDPRQSTKKSKV